MNGRTAEVVAIDPATASIVVATRTGKRQTLDMARVADRHIRPGWVQTIHAAQGATSDKVMAHLESFRSNVDASIAYTAVSRARKFAAIYTDDRLALVDAIEGRDGAKVGAIDETLLRGKIAAIAIPAPVKGVGIAIGILNRLADRHVRQGWVQTIHASQGATATRVLAHLESFRRNVDARALYVAVSRARDQARLYTDDRGRLTAAIELRDGAQVAALDEALPQHRVGTSQVQVGAINETRARDGAGIGLG